MMGDVNPQWEKLWDRLLKPAESQEAMDDYHAQNRRVIREEQEAIAKRTPPGTLWGVPVIESGAVSDGEIRFVQVKDGDIEIIGAITDIDEPTDIT